jgi:hypothetical protein
MKPVLFICGMVFFGSAVCGQVRDVPEVLPDTMRPAKGAEVPNELRPTDYFGRVQNPRLEAYDPYRSAFYREGRDTSVDRIPDGSVLRDLSHRYVVRYGSLPTVAVTSGRAVSVLLMRNGRIIVPKFADIVPPPEDMVQVIPVKKSPYLYFQANEYAVFPDDFNYTHVFIPMDLEGRPIQFQIRLKIVRPASAELVPMVILDMVGDFPDVLNEAGGVEPSSSSRVEAADAAVAGAVAAAAGYERNAYVFHGAGPTPVAAPFTREETRLYFPTMVEMAKLYEQAVYDEAPGYSKKDIVRFRPVSVKDNVVVSDKVIAFRNPGDGQIYYLPWGYYFPNYDAVVYELVFQNQTSKDLWFDYSLLKVLFGFDRVTDASPRGPKSVVVSPEVSEVTPAGRYNTLWVLVQGTGAYAVTAPVRFLFPKSTVVQSQGNVRPLSYGEGSVISVQGEGN